MTARVGRGLLPLIIPLILLGAWSFLHHLRGEELSFVTDPRLVLAKAWVIRGLLAQNCILSLWRLVLGLLIGTTLGMLTGIGLGRSPLARMVFGPTLNVLMAIPIIVIIPFFLMAFGFGELFRIAIVAALVLFLVHQAMFSAVRTFPTDLLELALHREKTERQIVLKMLLPASVPEIVDAARMALLFGWLAVAFAEKAVAEWPGGGLGYQLLRAREQGLFDEMFAAAITLAAVAWTLDGLVGVLHRRVAHWRRTAEAEQ